MFFINSTFAQSINFTKVKEDKVKEDKVKESNKKSFEEKKHKVGFNLGANSPLVKFYNEGSALSGSSFNFTYEYFITNNFSATFNYGRNKNGFSGVNEYYLYADAYGSFSDSYAMGEQDGLYKMNYVLLGVKYSLGSNVVKVYLNPSIGNSFLSVGPRTLETEKYNYDNINETIVNVETFESERNSSFMFGCSLGTDVRVSNLLSINLDMTLLNSKYDFKLYDRQVNEQFTYSTINYSLGLSFLF